MVRLSRIYTKTGDDGTTALGDGSRVEKHHTRIQSYGTVDELSSVLGLLLTEGIQAPLDERVRAIQNDLFDVGSDLSVPGEAGERLRISDSYTTRIEGWIDEANAELEPLNSFVLPGGTRVAAWLHLARTVCRRGERLVTELRQIEGEQVNAAVATYLNRLSDLFFVWARATNNGGKDDVLWQPGQNA